MTKCQRNSTIFQSLILIQNADLDIHFHWPIFAADSISILIINPVACIIKLLQSSFDDRHKWRQYHKHGE